MTDILIEPSSATIALATRSLPVLEISLGGSPDGLVILVGESGLLQDHGIEIMNRLAEHGYESLAADIAPEFARGAVYGLFDYAEERGWSAEQIGMIGFGLGGQTVLEAATRLDFGAAVSMSPTSPDAAPGVELVDVLAGPLATPWLGLFGDGDPGAAVESVQQLGAALDSSSAVHYEIVRYPGVSREFYGHANHDGQSYGAWYDGWQRTIEWLGARVAPRLTPLAVAWKDRLIDNPAPAGS